MSIIHEPLARMIGGTPSHVLTLIIHYFSKNEFKLSSNLSKRDGLNTSRHYETLVAKL